MKIRTRFAPSPTGYLHIGSLRTALYCYLFARHTKGDFVLRIEDTDQARSVANGIESIIKTLSAVGIDYDEGPILDGEKIIEKGNYGPYIQSQRLEIYKEHVDKLLENNTAYHCFCTSERLDKLREEQAQNKQPPMYDGKCLSLSKSEIDEKINAGTPYVIRLKVPEDGETKVTDLIHGEITFENKTIDDQVLLKSDGFPTYHLANVVDDHLMKITHVIRADEWLPSTPKHVLLYKAFGWDAPIFAHLPLLLNEDHSKLSKRSGDVAVEDYLKKGYLPEAMINFVALLGGNPSATQEIYSKEELIKLFNLEKLNKTGAVVNFEKLKWLNGHYIKQLSADKLTTLAIPYLIESGLINEASPQNYFAPKLEIGVSYNYIREAVELARDRMQTLADAPAITEFLFSKIDFDPNILVWKKSNQETAISRLKRVVEILTAIEEKNWSKEKIETIIKEIIAAEDLGVGDTLWPTRVALSGSENSPSPFEIAAVLDKNLTISRLEFAIKKLEQL